MYNNIDQRFEAYAEFILSLFSATKSQKDIDNIWKCMEVDIFNSKKIPLEYFPTSSNAAMQQLSNVFSVSASPIYTVGPQFLVNKLTAVWKDYKIIKISLNNLHLLCFKKIIKQFFFSSLLFFNYYYPEIQ